MDSQLLERLAVLAKRRDDSSWQEAADLILATGGFRWVGLYEVTETEIGAVVWTGTVAPAFPRFPRDRGLNGAAVSSRDAVVSQDVANDSRYLTAFESTGSEAIFPVLADDGQVVGTIDVESDRRDAFSAADVARLRACAVALRPLWQRR
jgi:putative methionine-R-sulfoxide reductase with GAF domain